MAKYKVRFSVVKEFEADNEDEIGAWQELEKFCEDNDCHMISDVRIKKVESSPS